MAPFVAELLASAGMGFALSGVTAAVAVLEPHARALAREHLPAEHAELVDGKRLFDVLMFVLLCTFFSETFARLSRSSVMNPAVLFLQRTVGGISTLQFLVGIVASTAGTCLGIFALKLTLTHVADSYPGFALVHPSRSMTILEHKEDFAQAALVEGLVAFSVLSFGSIVAPMAGRLGGIAAAAFYCLVAHYEGCRYTCSIMNPATIFALHLVLGGREHILKPETWERQAAYWAGGCGGAIAAGVTVLLVAWLFTRKTAPAKKKKAE